LHPQPRWGEAGGRRSPSRQWDGEGHRAPGAASTVARVDRHRGHGHKRGHLGEAPRDGQAGVLNGPKGIGRAALLRELEVESAIMIQSIFRGKKAREKLDSELAAEAEHIHSRLQRAADLSASLSPAEAWESQSMASAVGAVAFGEVELMETGAAMALQAAFRGHQTRKALSELRDLGMPAEDIKAVCSEGLLVGLTPLLGPVGAPA
jgi:hypothetical protein